MRLYALSLKNFRSFLDESIGFEALTAIVGSNGAGKSGILRALNEFYSTTRTVTLDDYYNRDAGAPIEIAVTFTDLTEQEQEMFASYVDDAKLTVTKVIDGNGERYHGTRGQNPDFRAVRDASSKSGKNDAYKKLREQEAYRDMPATKSADDVDTALAEWETANPGRLQPMLDDGKFFGFRQVGQARLERFTRFVLVPAVRHADQDAADSRGSAIFQLMELLVRGTMEKSEEFSQFRERTQREYGELMGPERIPQLGQLSESLTGILHEYVPTASVTLDWLEAEKLQFPLPKAAVRLREDNFDAPVDRVGHGLQRAFILSLLQGLAGVLGQGDAGGEGRREPLPDLILAIEEPELYQHPNRQRHLARVLRKLADGTIAGVERRTQVVYCTHSPLFLEMRSFDGIRRLHKKPHAENAAAPLVTAVCCARPTDLAAKLLAVQDDPRRDGFTGETFVARLANVMTPTVNEGFFGESVVLVEGEEDRAALLGCAELMGIELEAAGMAVVVSGGKTCMDRPLLIYSQLGIPAYLIFDSDVHKAESGHPETNRVLQRLAGREAAAVEDFPDTIVTESFAVMSPSLTHVLKAVCDGGLHERCAMEFAERYGYKAASDCWKSPHFVRGLLETSRCEGKRVTPLESVMDALRAVIARRRGYRVAPAVAVAGE